MHLSGQTSYCTITLAFEQIDISSSKCVHLCVDIKHVNINASEHAIIKEFQDKISNHQSVQAFELKSIQASGNVIN